MSRFRALAEALIADTPGAGAVFFDAVREDLGVELRSPKCTADAVHFLEDAFDDADTRDLACELWALAFEAWEVTRTLSVIELIARHRKGRGEKKKIEQAAEAARRSCRWPEDPAAVPYAMRMAVIRGFSMLSLPRHPHELLRGAAIAAADLVALRTAPDRFSPHFDAAQSSSYADVLRRLADRLDR